MTTIDGSPLTDLVNKVDTLRAANEILGVADIAHPIIAIHLPVELPATTTLLRGTTAIGYINTPAGAPAPTGASVTLTSGTLWIQASLLGAAFSSVSGLAGVPFQAPPLRQ